MSDEHVPVTLSSLHLYPLKSAAGISPREAMLVETGLDLDRSWAIVDERGAALTQRRWPRMALIRPTLRAYDVVLRAPGMLALHVQIDAVESRSEVEIFGARMPAWDIGDLAAQWCSDFLGTRCRLARFDPEHPRLSERRWSGEIEAANAFSDGFPLLVASTASLDELNRRLAAAGRPAVTMARFRPNLVLDGLQPHDEDHLDEIRFDTAEGPVRLRLVKPCGRCNIPDVDPETGEAGQGVAAMLASYRADPRIDGASSFAMNAVIVEGVERTLRVGMPGSASWRFE